MWQRAATRRGRGARARAPPRVPTRAPRAPAGPTRAEAPRSARRAAARPAATAQRPYGSGATPAERRPLLEGLVTPLSAGRLFSALTHVLPKLIQNLPNTSPLRRPAAARRRAGQRARGAGHTCSPSEPRRFRTARFCPSRMRTRTHRFCPPSPLSRSSTASAGRCRTPSITTPVHKQSFTGAQTKIGRRTHTNGKCTARRSGAGTQRRGVGAPARGAGR
jgi:hypothetical protein